VLAPILTYVYACMRAPILIYVYVYVYACSYTYMLAPILIYVVVYVYACSSHVLATRLVVLELGSLPTCLYTCLPCLRADQVRARVDHVP
jgi:hypothetical protein